MHELDTYIPEEENIPYKTSVLRQPWMISGFLNYILFIILYFKANNVLQQHYSNIQILTHTYVIYKPYFVTIMPLHANSYYDYTKRV